MKFKHRAKLVYKQLIFNLSANDNPLFLSFYKHFYKPKPGSLPSFIDQYSKKFGPVSFLQIGANDGFNHDPLHKFIKRDNWTGVMLEPQAKVFEQFLIKLHAKRPGITAINAALDLKDGVKKLYKVAFSEARWATGLSSFSEEELLKMVKNGRIKKEAEKEGVTIPEDEKDYISSVDINTISPSSLYKNHGTNFKLLMIDTEGFDFQILKMLDLSLINPEVIIYEEYNLSEEEKRESHAYLEKHGYTFISISRDALCVKKDNEDLVRLLNNF